MPAPKLRKAFNARGVFIFAMTPFKPERSRRADYEVDLEGVQKNVHHFCQVPGEKVVVVCGGSGEFDSLKPKEVVDIAAAAVAGARGQVKIVCGVGGANKGMVDLAQDVQKAGADAVLVLPHEPIVKRGEKAILERHQILAKNIDIGFMPFRAPKQPLGIDLIEKFAQTEQVVAIKEESGAVDWVRTGRRVTGNAVPFITGGGENMVPYYYLAGSVGFTSGMSNITLGRSIELHNRAIRADWPLAMELRDFFEPLTEMRREFGLPMLKAGLEMLGLAGGPVRKTGAVLDPNGRRRLRRILEEKDLL
jgi:5-dehydro-4-deoxyglucarate dehydratase